MIPMQAPPSRNLTELHEGGACFDSDWIEPLDLECSVFRRWVLAVCKRGSR